MRVALTEQSITMVLFRPMLGVYNSSKQDDLADGWLARNPTISRSVNSDYASDLAKIQTSVQHLLDALLKSFA